MKIPKPELLTPYRRIFLPEPAVYSGTPNSELVPGSLYPEWVPNDHCFAFDRNGMCHIFGITHPLTSCRAIHAGEEQLFHAAAKAEFLLTGEPFRDCGNLLPPADRPGEPAARNQHRRPVLVRAIEQEHIRMKLDGRTVKSEADILRALHDVETGHEEFAVLSQADLDFIQTAGGELEYRDSTGQFRVADAPVSAEMIQKAFLSYYRGDGGCRIMFQWELLPAAPAFLQNIKRLLFGK